MTWLAGPLKHWLEANDSGVWGDDPSGDNDTTVLRSTDIALDGSWTIANPAVRNIPDSQRLSKRLLTGDLVVVTSSGSEAHLGKTAIVDHEVETMRPVFANFVQRLRTSADAEPRFVRYVLMSTRTGEEMGVLGNTTTGLRNLNGSIIGATTFPGAPLAEQRAIADYLDVETARIDALIAKKQQLIHLLEERLTDFVETALFASEKRTRLDRLTDDSRQIMYGIVLPGPDVGTGVAIVKGGNVRNHRIQGHVCHTTHEIAAPYTRSQLRAGDLAIIIRGAGAGRVANVSAEHNGWNITQDVARVAPARGVRSDWLRHVLEARPVQAQLKVRVGGATITGINIWDLKRLEVPDASTMEQELVSQQINEAESSSLATTAALARQIELLAERRQALITAAVTGEFTVPGAP